MYLFFWCRPMALSLHARCTTVTCWLGATSPTSPACWSRCRTRSRHCPCHGPRREWWWPQLLGRTTWLTLQALPLHRLLASHRDVLWQDCVCVCDCDALGHMFYCHRIIHCLCHLCGKVCNYTSFLHMQEWDTNCDYIDKGAVNYDLICLPLYTHLAHI